MFTPEWRERRKTAAAGAAPKPVGLTGLELWGLLWPELFGEIELDLAQTSLIPNLDAALDSRPWHFVRAGIERLIDIDGTWVQKAVRDGVRRRRAAVQDPDGRGGSLQEGSV
ncbi:hypothetical protein [Microbacterium sp. BR1]|uniref:hypothetical protein n=1 Tax=Microbacterium sp. BR1 TaxID=1070896 RepID=UPI0018E25B09|nr:hypothetical protein [Microbacterium sp. BR1]